jgi:hypothetical protein
LKTADGDIRPIVSSKARRREADPNSVRNEPPPSAVERMHAYFVKARDRVLLFGSMAYLLGYAVWMSVAYRENLGPLPLVQTQYLVAGLIPLLLVFAAFGAGYVTRGFYHLINGLATSSVARIAAATKLTVGASCVVVLTALAVSLAMNLFLGHYKTATAAVALGAIAVIYPAIPYVRNIVGGRPQPKEAGWEEWLMVTAFPLAFAALLIYIFAVFAFPYISQDIGGALPRVAQLDVVVDDLSPDERAALLPKGAPPSGKVARTNKVFVCYRNDQRLLLKAYPSLGSQTYELAGASVKGTVWFSRVEALRTIPVPSKLAKRP